MLEKNIQTKLLQANTIHGVFELKLCKTNSIRFDAVKEHQVKALMQAESSQGIIHKISDHAWISEGDNKFTHKKPFDFFHVKNTPAFVVICFYVPRKKKTCYYIRISEWIKAEKKSEKKSITEDEIKNIYQYKFELI